MKIETWQADDVKAKWKIVRTDTYTDVTGEILSADEATGECCLRVNAETKTLSFGPGGIKIIRRDRR